MPMYLLSLRWILLDVPLAASAIDSEVSGGEDAVEKLLDCVGVGEGEGKGKGEGAEGD